MKVRLIILIIVLLNSCQNKNAAQVPSSSKEIEAEFMQLFKEYLRVSISNRDSALIINDKMTSTLLNLYSVDSTNPVAGQYLVDCYSIKEDLQQVIRWSNHSLKYATYYAPNIGRYNKTIGYAYIRSGQLDSAKSHFKIYIDQARSSSYTFEMRGFIKSLFAEADSIYQGKDSLAIGHLIALKIKPCQYYLAIWEFIIPEAEKFMDKNFLLERKKEKLSRSKDCR